MTDARARADREAEVAQRIAEFRLNPSPRTTAFVIMVERPGQDTRYYSGKSKTGRLETAWSISGAKAFVDTDHPDYAKAVRFIEKKGGRAVLAKIKLCDAATERPASSGYHNPHPHLSFVEEPK